MMKAHSDGGSYDHVSASFEERGSRDGSTCRRARTEFGRDAAAGLAQRFVDAEGVDFHWDARVEERWLGSYEAVIDDDLELDRVAIIGRLDGRWYVALCIVDGDGMPHGLSGCRSLSRSDSAREAFSKLH